MTEPLQLPPPLEGDISLRTLGRLAGRLDNIDLSVLMVFLVDIVDSSALPWLGEQFSLSGDGWELAESDDVRRMLIKAAIELHRYKGTPWSIREVIRRFGFGVAASVSEVLLVALLSWVNPLAVSVASGWLRERTCSASDCAASSVFFFSHFVLFASCRGARFDIPSAPPRTGSDVSS